MDISICVVLFVMTMVTLIYMATKLSAVMDLCEKNRVIREECKYEIPKLTLFIRPSKFMKPIKENVKVIKRDKETIEDTYKKFYCAFCFYVFWAVLHAVICIIMLLNIFKQFPPKGDVAAVRMAFFILEVIFFYNVYLTPLFNAIGLHKVAAFGPAMWEFMQLFCDRVTKWFFIGFEFVGSLVVLGLSMSVLGFYGVSDVLLIVLIFLVMYHYVFLRLVAWIIKLIVYGFKGLEKYRADDFVYLMYRRLKSTTFISIIVVNVIADTMNEQASDMTFYKAMGFVFSLDSYIEQRFPRKKRKCAECSDITITKKSKDTEVASE